MHCQENRIFSAAAVTIYNNRIRSFTKKRLYNKNSQSEAQTLSTIEIMLTII